MLTLPLTAIGPNCVPALERCVRGMVVTRGWEERSRPEALAKLPVRPVGGVGGTTQDGLARLLTAMNAIEYGQRLCDERLQISKLDKPKPLSELCATFGITLNEGRMCIRLFIASEHKGAVVPTDIRDAEIWAGIRGADGRIVEDFR
jgi:hypothetical protein